MRAKERKELRSSSHSKKEANRKEDCQEREMKIGKRKRRDWQEGALEIEGRRRYCQEKSKVTTTTMRSRRMEKKL